MKRNRLKGSWWQRRTRRRSRAGSGESSRPGARARRRFSAQGPLARLRALLSGGRNRRVVKSRDASSEQEASSPGQAAAEPKRRRRPRRARRWLRGVGQALVLWVLPVVIAVATFAAPVFGVRAYRYVMQTGHFHAKHVLVDGNERLDYPTIAQLAGIGPGTHVLAANLKAMERGLRAHPWIAHASVSRELPDRLIIEIVEQEPVAYVLLDGELALANQSGEIFARVNPGEDYQLPIVTGVASEDLVNPQRSASARADIRAAVNVARLYSSMNLQRRWALAEVRVEPGRQVTLVIGDLGTEARLGPGPYRDKLYRLEWVLENLRQQDKVADYVLLDGGSGTRRDDGRVVVRADVAPTRRELAEEAAAHARAEALDEPPELHLKIREPRSPSRVVPPAGSDRRPSGRRTNTGARGPSGAAGSGRDRRT